MLPRCMETDHRPTNQCNTVHREEYVGDTRQRPRMHTRGTASITSRMNVSVDSTKSTKSIRNLHNLKGGEEQEHEQEQEQEQSESNQDHQRLVCSCVEASNLARIDRRAMYERCTSDVYCARVLRRVYCTSDVYEYCYLYGPCCTSDV